MKQYYKYQDGKMELIAEFNSEQLNVIDYFAELSMFIKEEGYKKATISDIKIENERLVVEALAVDEDGNESIERYSCSIKVKKEKDPEEDKPTSPPKDDVPMIVDILIDLGFVVVGASNDSITMERDNGDTIERRLVKAAHGKARAIHLETIKV
jgi:hypothetical protein